MKKRKISFLIILTVILSGVLAYGNSGPVTWFQYPGISMITIDEDTPITVLKEDLHFDFSEEERNDYSLIGKVSAKYRMKNTGEESINSRMVFPFIKNLWGVEKDQIEVFLDGNPIDYKIYYGETVSTISSGGEFEESIELQDILKSITDEKYSPKNFNYEEKGTLYRIHLETDRDESMHVEAYFTTEMGSSRILAKGNNSYAYYNERNEFSVGTWLYEEKRIMEIFSFDEDLNIKIRGFQNGASDAEEATDFRYEIEEVEMDIEHYLFDFIATDTDIYSNIYVPEDKNVYYKALDQALERELFISEDHISSLLIASRYVLIAYEVPFEALEEKTVEVRYPTLGSMDKRETVEPTYTYNYFLHPAKYWKEFHDLTIRITPSKDYPYVLKSNLPLIKETDGTYVGTFETLPTEDLSFTLYEKEEITTSEKIKNTLDKNIYLLLFIGLPLLVILSLVVLGLMVIKVVQLHIKNKSFNRL
ncbi:MAG: hypothetical protein IBX70_08600 [Clostridia bacterium]|nr:hypothetical protein [Clostridia bacterium]